MLLVVCVLCIIPVDIHHKVKQSNIQRHVYLDVSFHIQGKNTGKTRQTMKQNTFHLSNFKRQQNKSNEMSKKIGEKETNVEREIYIRKKTELNRDGH